MFTELGGKPNKKMVAKVIAALSAQSNPISPARLQALKSYQKAIEIQKYSKETLLPCIEIVEKITKKARKASRMVKNQAERLSETQDGKISANYIKHAAYLVSSSEEAPGFLMEQFDAKIKLENAIQEYQRLYKECKAFRTEEASNGIVRHDEEFQAQNRVLTELVNTTGTVNRAILVLEESFALLQELTPATLQPAEAVKSGVGAAICNGFKIQRIEAVRLKTEAAKLQAAEQENQILEEENKVLQSSLRETKKAIKEASNLAAKMDVVVTLEELNSNGSVPLCLDVLQRKIETLTTQLEEFCHNKQDKKLVLIKRAFNKVFAIDTQESKTIIEESHYQFLKFLYQLNQEYYLAVKEKLAGLKLSDTSQFVMILSDLEKIKCARVSSAKQFLEKYHIKDVAFLTKLLVPVHRAVFRFKKEHLDPIVKLAALDKQKRLDAQLDAAQAKLEQAKASDEFSCEKSYENFKKYMLDFKKRLEGVLSEQKDPAHYIDAILALEKEIKTLVLDPVESICTEMLTQQNMLVQKQKEKEQEQKNSAELFVPQNFMPEKLPLLVSKGVLNILEKLFSSADNVTYLEVQNMLRILRGEEVSAGSVQNHSFFQFPCLWNGYDTPPQVLISIPHREGMPMQKNIQDPNVIAELKRACVNAGMEYERLKRVAEDYEQSVKIRVAS